VAMKKSMLWRGATAVCLLLACACGQKEDPTPADSSGVPVAGSDSSGAPIAGDTGTGAGAGAQAGSQAPSAGTGGDGEQPSAGAAAPGDDGAAGTESVAPPPEVIDMLDSSTDWTALVLVFPQMHSAYDGVHTFQVPVHVDGATIELSGWQAIPSSAVTFDPDPDQEGGVLITVLEPVAEITIAASSGAIGGTAPLYVTEGTPEQWEVGKARYNNGVEYEMPNINLLDLFDPNYMPPETPTNLACNNCHTTGAKYLEIQHTPTQIAYISDEDLQTIFTQGMKPDGIAYTVLPPPLEFLYPEFHTWDATDDEVKGLIIYLRSLTPTVMGDIQIPDTLILPMM
jgi:hypothetical protein